MTLHMLTFAFRGMARKQTFPRITSQEFLSGTGTSISH